MQRTLSAILGILAACPAGMTAGEVIVPMKDKGADTYYVDVHVEGFGHVDYLVDTGAGYMTINQDTLTVLQANNNAVYVKRLQGIMADGRSLIVPVYRVRGINIGGSCRLDEVEVAVFPGGSRSLLGLSALRKTAPFMFSMEPPELQMSNCGDAVLQQEPRRVEGVEAAAPAASMSAVSTAEKPGF